MTLCGSARGPDAVSYGSSVHRDCRHQDRACGNVSKGTGRCQDPERPGAVQSAPPRGVSTWGPARSSLGRGEAAARVPTRREQNSNCSACSLERAEVGRGRDASPQEAPSLPPPLACIGKPSAPRAAQGSLRRPRSRRAKGSPGSGLGRRGSCGGGSARCSPERCCHRRRVSRLPPVLTQAPPHSPARLLSPGSQESAQIQGGLGRQPICFSFWILFVSLSRDRVKARRWNSCFSCCLLLNEADVFIFHGRRNQCPYACGPGDFHCE